MLVSSCTVKASWHRCQRLSRMQAEYVWGSLLLHNLVTVADTDALKDCWTMGRLRETRKMPQELLRYQVLGFQLPAGISCFGPMLLSSRVLQAVICLVDPILHSYEVSFAFRQRWLVYY